MMVDILYLGDLIDNSGVTKSFIAEKLGISRTTLDSRLSGKTDFSLKELNMLCSILRLTMEERQKILAPMFKES